MWITWWRRGRRQLLRTLLCTSACSRSLLLCASPATTGTQLDAASSVLPGSRAVPTPSTRLLPTTSAGSLLRSSAPAGTQRDVATPVLLGNSSPRNEAAVGTLWQGASRFFCAPRHATRLSGSPKRGKTLIFSVRRFFLQDCCVCGNYLPQR